MSERRILALVAGLLLALPTVAAAQEGQHRHGEEPAREQGMQERMGTGMQGCPMMMGHDGGMMGMMGMGMGMAAPGPMMILHHGDALDLTDEQVEKLQALQERLDQTRKEHMEAAQALHRKLSEQAEGAEMDLEAYESALRELADQRVAMHLAMARAGLEAREVLTPEQREKLRVGAEFMRDMMEMMRERMDRMSGMEGGSGMSGDMDDMGGMGGGMMGMDGRGMGGGMMGEVSCPMMGGGGRAGPTP